MAKVEIDTEACIGCSACTAISDNFKMGDDNKAHVMNAEVDDPSKDKEAADACPVQCIKISE